ncbi:alpha beta-hydrolase [Trametopsis cervina]|nr:alpha beta-hydrolase [Trametopsis cervina]
MCCCSLQKPQPLMALVVAVLSLRVGAKSLPDSYPHIYPEIPSEDYSTKWQSYFAVNSSSLGLGFDVGNSYAGNINVQRENHPNNTLYFWGFESQNGSLTAGPGELADRPWAVWLQGGPGTSSLYGLLTENGPIQMTPGTQNLTKNSYAWSGLVDYFWIDQPVGVGYSTADANGYAADETQVAQDFVGFLTNLVQVFPSLQTRPFLLTGESYAGRYIPYISQALLSMPKPPVNLSKLAIGNPALGSNSEFKTMPTLSLIETYPQIIGYDTQVYDYFANQAHLCGLDLNLTYPQQGGGLPVINLVEGQNQKHPYQHDLTFAAEVAKRHEEGLSDIHLSSRSEKTAAHSIWKRDLTGRSNHTIDPWYGCYIWDEMVDYAVNFTYPWSQYDFNTFDVPDALKPGPSTDPAFFLNQAPVRAALHAPDKTWSVGFNYPWGNQASGIDTSPEPMTFLSALASNASSHGIKIVLYSGNDDAISPHFGTEVTIQNTTFGGIQGFTERPSTPWWDDNGNWAGIVHQERDWTYALIHGAGHDVPSYRPVAAYTFLREFIIGSNQTGAVSGTGEMAVTSGGKNPTLQQVAIPGRPDITYGLQTAQGTTVWPSATVAAFESHVGQVEVTGTNPIAPRETSHHSKSSAMAANAGAPSGKSIILKCLVVPAALALMFLV